jgi:DNA adenine methylase
VAADNPFSICAAAKRREGLTDEEEERCILELKKKLGLHAEALPCDPFDPSHEILEYISAPFSVYGGKRYLASKIAPLVPRMKRYVEAFAGAAAVLFAREPSGAEEILTDIDPEKVHCMLYLKGFSEQDRRKLAAMDWAPSKELFKRLKTARFSDPTERFYRYMYTRWNSFGSRGDSWSVNSAAASWQNYIGKRMMRYRERLKDVKVYLMDWKVALKKFDSPDTFFYLDPPYIGTANKQAAHFKEPSAQELGSALKAVKGKWILSNHDVPELRAALHGFQIMRVSVPTQVDQMHASSKRARPEILASNFPLSQRGVMAASEETCSMCGTVHDA